MSIEPGQGDGVTFRIHLLMHTSLASNNDDPTEATANLLLKALANP